MKKIRHWFSNKWREFADFLIILFSRDPAKVQWKIIERLQRQYKDLIFPDESVERNMKQDVLNQKKALLSEADKIMKNGWQKSKDCCDLALNMQLKGMVSSDSSSLDEMVEKLEKFDDKSFTAFKRAISCAENLETDAEKEVRIKMHDAVNKMAAMSQNPEDSPEEEIIALDIHINGKWCTSCVAENNSNSVSTVANEVVVHFLNNREIKREIYYPSSRTVNFIVG